MPRSLDEFILYLDKIVGQKKSNRTLKDDIGVLAKPTFKVLSFLILQEI